MLSHGLLKFKHTPDQLLDILLMPVTFVLMFVFLFGNAVSGDWRTYVQFVIPGIAVQALMFATLGSALALNTDLRNGIFDRFLARHRREQTQQIRPGLSARLYPPNPSRDPGHQVIQTRRPPRKIFCGHQPKRLQWTVTDLSRLDRIPFSTSINAPTGSAAGVLESEP